MVGLLILGLQGSPRKKGSTDYLLSTTHLQTDIGLDMAFRKPSSIESIHTFDPDHIISMSPKIQVPDNYQAQTWTWDLPDPHSDATVSIQSLRKQIQAKVDDFLK